MAVDPVRKAMAAGLSTGLAFTRKGQAKKKNPAADEIARRVSRGVADSAFTSPLKQWLADDATFQRQRTRLDQEKDRYLRDFDVQLGRANTDYGTARDRLIEARSRALADQAESLAVRGMDQSSVAVQDEARLHDQYDEQASDLERDRQRVADDLKSNRQTFMSGLRNERLNARQEAIRRRTQSLGLR